MRRDTLLIVASAAVTAAGAALLAWHVSGLPDTHPDFAMMWAAMQLPDPYDQAALKAQLGWVPTYPVAFIYPPTALPIFALFAFLPMRAALASWAALSGAAMAVASRSVWAPLLLLAPPVLWALPGGQMSLLMGAMLLGSLLLVRRPLLAGGLVGIALALKPQLAIVVPLLFLLDRRWAALGAAASAFASAAIISALLFGPRTWIDWFTLLPGFLDMHESRTALGSNEIAPGLPIWLRAFALVAGAWFAARSLERGNPVEAFVIASGAALIGSAHAMGYEFALIAPACPALIARRGWSAGAVVIFLLAPAFIWAGLPAFPLRFLAVLILVAAAVVDGLALRGLRFRSGR